jgi:homoserine dehydrogenase
VRVWVVGFGTVGQLLVDALDRSAAKRHRRHGIRFEVVGLANRRDGFVHREDGIDLRSALTHAAAGRPLRELAGVSHWGTRSANVNPN